MKKLFTLLISLLSFTFIVNAKEEWIFEELKLPEDIGITALAIRGPLKDMSPITPVLAIGNEYNCTKEGYTNQTCNVYIIDYDGKVQKYNMYYNNTNNDFPGHIRNVISLDSNKLKKTIIGNMMYDSKEHMADDGGPGTVVNIIHKDMNFNYLSCSNDKHTDRYDICVVEVENGGYGIIDSNGSFIVEPSTNYSKVFDDYAEHPAILKDENNDYIIVSGNGKIEKIEKSFMDENGFSINSLQISNYDSNTNYYSYAGTPCPEGQTCAQVVSDTIFTKNKVLRTLTGGTLKTVFVADEPYIVQTLYVNSLFSSDTLQDFNGNTLIASMDEASYGHELLSYNKSGKFYITDMKKNIVEKSLEENISGIMLLDESGYHNAYVYKEYKNVAVLGDDWKPKYYILKKVTIEDKPTETDKEKQAEYICKRVDGVFYDKDGNKVTKTEYEKSCPEKVPDTGYLIPTLTISLLSGGITLILRKKNLISKI